MLSAEVSRLAFRTSIGSVAAALLFVACSSEEPNTATTPAAGGATSVTSSGGATGSAGGAPSPVGGGTLGLGGAVTSVGTSSTPTTPPLGQGGTSTVGSGGSTAKGGSTTSGGSTAKGGSTTSGGSTAKGGSTTSGGSTAKGGSTTSGGSTAKGGSTTSGGSTAKGGSTTSGGSTAKGGSTTSGGSTAKGGTASLGGSTGTTTHTGPWKLTALGDSITGTTCYPQLLAQALITGSHSNFTMVGSNLNNQSCNGAPTRQTEGHGGYLVTYLLTDSPPLTGKGTLTELNNWTNAATDVLLIHFGTNDVWSNIAPTSIVSAYEFVIGKYRAKNPNLIVFVSKIISMNPSGCADCPTRVTNLDALISATWATAQSTATSPVYVIDHSTAINTATDTGDGVHPNVTGAQKMATVTYNALIAGHLPGI